MDEVFDHMKLAAALTLGNDIDILLCIMQCVVLLLKALAYAKERKTMGTSIMNHQVHIGRKSGIVLVSRELCCAVGCIVYAGGHGHGHRSCETLSVQEFL